MALNAFFTVSPVAIAAFSNPSASGGPALAEQSPHLPLGHLVAHLLGAESGDAVDDVPSRSSTFSMWYLKRNYGCPDMIDTTEGART